ncbi:MULTISPECIES: type II toxin-antitoxin system HicA family toxin [unclassified Adlercreutzia]|uniref:type II toxin-antitoxin system HicA family toxin n=1 Tax=unclassified Adlercreutzia TaxID=2636013 RepID=UPI0013EBC138|nr:MULTISPECIES: type II toxin-antitoxin system HicA family toxin [unclassified Adlercreutzia]
MTKRRDIVRALVEGGYVSDGGTNHEHFVKGTKVVMVPRHREIPDETAKRILRQAGLR